MYYIFQANRINVTNQQVTLEGNKVTICDRRIENTSKKNALRKTEFNDENGTCLRLQIILMSNKINFFKNEPFMLIKLH